MWFAYTLLACLGFGVGAAMQKHGMATALPRLSARTLLREWRRVLGTLSTNRIWVLGIAFNLTGGLFQILALDAGEISVVQPLINLNLLAAVLIGVTVLRERLSALEWLGAAALLAGAALVSASGFVGASGTTAGAATAPAVLGSTPDRVVLWVGAGCAALVILLNLAGRALRRLPAELLLAVSAGLLFGVGAAAIKVISLHLAAAGGMRAGLATWCATLFADPALWGTVGVTVVGFVIYQLAFSHGRVAIVQPVVTMAAAVVPVAAGVLAFGETLGLVRATGIAVVLAGATLLSVPGNSADLA